MLGYFVTVNPHSMLVRQRPSYAQLYYSVAFKYTHIVIAGAGCISGSNFKGGWIWY